MPEAIISHQECEDLVKKVFGKLNDCIMSFKLNLIGEVPLGFLGNHYELAIEIKNKLINEVHQLSFFVKTKPTVATHIEYVDDIGVFPKETELFENLLPKLQNVTSFLKSQWSPKCYITKKDVLVFENLAKQNYQMATDRLVDLEHCKIIVKTLAEFHAASVILEKKENIAINKVYPNVIKEATYILEEGYTRNKWLLSGINALTFICKMSKREKEAHLLSSKIKGAVAKVKPSVDSQNVLCHGDLWLNNFMFKYNDNKVEGCVLVDFQLVRYAAAALDVMCCLHLVTSKNIRDSNLQQLLKIYYDRFVTVLENSEVNIENIPSEKEFLLECDKYKSTALAEACLYGLCIWLPKSFVGKILNNSIMCKEFTLGDKTSFIAEAFKDNDVFYKNHLTSLLDEFLDL